MVLIAIEPRSGEVFSNSTLASIEKITELAWLLPYSIRVDSLTNYQHTVAENDDLMVDSLVSEPEQLSNIQLANIKTVALNEPLLRNRLISSSGDVAAVAITVSLPGKSISEVPNLANAVRDLKGQVTELYPDVDLYLTGTVMLNDALSSVARYDFKHLMPVMLLVIIFFLYYMLRSFTGVISCVVVILFSVISGMGMFGWLGNALTPASFAAPIIIMVIAVADCVHILATYFRHLREGCTKTDSMHIALNSNVTPIALTTITTVIGFLAMNTSEVPPFRDLGNLVALGITMAFLLSVFFLPALILAIPSQKQKAVPDSVAPSPVLAAINKLSIQHRGKIFWSSTIITIMLVSFIPNNSLNDEFVEFFSDSVEFKKDTDFTAERLTGIYNIEYSFDTGETNGVNDPEFLYQLDLFSAWAESLSSVVHVNAITDVYKRLNKNMHADQQEWYKLPESKVLASQYMLLYEMSLPFGLTTDNQLNTDKSSTKVTITLKNISSAQTLQLEKEINKWIAVNTPLLSEYYAASPNLMFSHAGYLNAKSMIFGTVFAIALITIVMCFALRSIRYGMLSAVMNLIPIGIAFGIWALIDGSIGMSLTTAVGMALGIVVDDTVHLLYKYLIARRELNLDQKSSLEYAYSSVSPAIVITSIVLISGFTVLGFSNFGINADRGVFASITIAMALYALYAFTPRLLISNKSKQPEKQPVLEAPTTEVYS